MTTTGSHAAPWSMKLIVRMLTGAPSPRRRPPTTGLMTGREAVARALYSEQVGGSKLDLLDYDASPVLRGAWEAEADRRITHAESPDREVAAFHRIPAGDWIHLPSLTGPLPCRRIRGGRLWRCSVNSSTHSRIL